MDKCVIFGGNGFIGSHLAESLLQKGHKVKIFDTFQSGTNNIANIYQEVESTEDAATLFRGNTTTTKIMAAYSRLAGK